VKNLVVQGEIARSQAKKSATSIVALNPQKEDGGVFCHLAVTAPRLSTNQSVFGLVNLCIFKFFIIH
jgi:hypothetical protein